MRLAEIFQETLRHNSMAESLTIMEEEIERRFCKMDDVEKIEETFFDEIQTEQHPFKKRQYPKRQPNSRYDEYMEFFHVVEREIIRQNLRKQFIHAEVIVLAEELEGMRMSYELDLLEQETSQETQAEAKRFCQMIGGIEDKEMMKIWLQDKGRWKLDHIYPMGDFHDGETTYQDIAIKIDLLKIMENKVPAIAIIEGKTQQGFALQEGTWQSLSKEEIDYISLNKSGVVPFFFR